jgi:para-nitrobenzyl esterase
MQAEADAAGRDTAEAVHCTDPDTVLACLRRTPVSAFLDLPSRGFVLPVRGTSLLPRDPRTAVAEGAFAHVPVVVGATRDEGRTFEIGAIGWSRDQYTAWVRQNFGPRADDVLARYPWPARATRFTPAYLTAAIVTDSGSLLGIGGCTNRQLTMDLARYTRTYAYEFAHRTGPGLTPRPEGYVWGAGHAAELAYLFPSFDNGTPIAPTFDAGERRLAAQMKSYWGTFARTGRPDVLGQPVWAPYDVTAHVLSLRSGRGTRLVPDATIAAEHQCAFWDGRTS